MSVFGDYEAEMQTQTLLDDQTIESILTGRTPSNRPELDDLACLVTEVRSVASGPAPRVGAQLAAVLAGGLSTDKGDLSATAASNVPGPGNQAAGLPKRRKSMLETIFAKAALAKAAAVLGVAAADVGDGHVSRRRAPPAAASLIGEAAMGDGEDPGAELLLSALEPAEAGEDPQEDLVDQAVGVLGSLRPQITGHGAGQVVVEPLEGPGRVGPGRGQNIVES